MSTPEAVPHLRRGRAEPVAQGVLGEELLALLELGLAHVLVHLAEAEDPEGDVASLVGEDVAQQLAQQRLLGAAQHLTERGEGEALDDDLHPEVGDVPAGVLEQAEHLALQVRTHRVGVADLLAEVALEDLGVPGLVHRLGGGVVLGVDPRHRLDDLRRRQHRPLLAVDELAQLRLERLESELGELSIATTRRSASREGPWPPWRGPSPALPSR